MTAWPFVLGLPLLAAGLGLAGCAGRARVTDTLDAGPLRLQQLEQQSGLQITVNTAGRVTYYTLQLAHQGRPVEFPNAGSGRLQTTRDARQGWLLTAAPRPAALLATDRWLLVTEQDGRPLVQEIAPGGRRWRWLATEGEPPLDAAAEAGGHGGTRTERQPLALAGGRRLLLEETVVLDVTTLRVRPVVDR